MELKEVAAAIEALLAAPAPEDGLAVLERHADALGTPEALELIDSNIAHYADDPEARGLLENRRLIVSEFQRAGIDAARAVVRAGPVAKMLNAWLACDGWDAAFRFLEQHDQVLLGAEAERLLGEAAGRYAEDPHGGPKINACRALAGIAREAGLVEARRWLCRQLLARLNDDAGSLGPEVQAAYFETLIALTDREQDAEAWIAVNVNYGTLLRSLGRQREAVGRFEAALEVITPGRWAEHYSGTHRSLGNVYMSAESEDLERAVFHFEEALRTISVESEPANYLHIHHMLGLACSLSGDREKALSHFREALAVPAEHSREQWAQVSADLANALIDDYSRARQPALLEAIERLETALAHLDPQTDAERWARSQRNLGMAYRDIESADRPQCLDKAIRHTSAALSVWTQELNPYAWAQLQHNLGTVYFLRRHGDVYDNLSRAVSHYQQALSVHTRERHPNDWALTQAALGMCLMRLYESTGRDEHLDAAAGALRRSLEWWTGEGGDGSVRSRGYRAEAENGLGAVLVMRTRHGGHAGLEDGIAHLLEAEAIYAALGMEERQRAILMNLSDALSTLAETEPAALARAFEAAQRAIALTPRETDAYSWALFQRNYAALLSNSGDPAYRGEAIGHIEAALEVFTRERFPGEYCRTHGFLGHLHFLDRDWNRALLAYSRAADATGQLVTGTYTESGQEHEIAESSIYFMRAAFCLVELGRPGEALEMLDRGKGRALSLDLALDAALKADEGDAILVEAHKQVVELEAEMRLPAARSGRRSDAELGRALEQAREALDRALGAAGIEARADLELAEILETVPAGGAMVALLVTSEGSVAFVIPAGTAELTKRHLVRRPFSTANLHAMLIGGESEPGLVRTYLRMKSARRRSEADARLAEYRRQLNACCASIWHDLLADVARLLVELGVPEGAPLRLLPQGGLGMLPLHAACDETAPPDSPEHRPLLGRYAISYAPSAYLLAASKRELADNEAGRAPSLLAAINPTSDLDFAEIEGALVAEVFARLSGRQNARVLPGRQASLSNVRSLANGCEYLHFACHGVFDFRDVGRSALYLAGREALEMAELLGPGFDLSQSRLVVLSACETGLTEFQRSPDEYMGLPASFLKAGAPAVLSTLWEVDDISTCLLIAEFYRRHLVDGQSPARALCEAQVWLGRACREEVVTWIEDALATLRARSSGDDVSATVLRELASVGREIADGVFGAQPFRDPWYWAAFCLSGV